MLTQEVAAARDAIGAGAADDRGRCDRAGRISIRRIDRQFGEHVDEIVAALKNAA